MRLVLSNIQHKHSRIDETLVGLIARGYRWRHELVQGIRSSAVEIARREGVTDAYVCRLMGWSFLAPDILEGIVSGGQKSQYKKAALYALCNELAKPNDADRHSIRAPRQRRIPHTTGL
jgi:hypothetical protein